VGQNETVPHHPRDSGAKNGQYGQRRALRGQLAVRPRLPEQSRHALRRDRARLIHESGKRRQKAAALVDSACLAIFKIQKDCIDAAVLQEGARWYILIVDLTGKPADRAVAHRDTTEMKSFIPDTS
jgi:hypothetical protein